MDYRIKSILIFLISLFLTGIITSTATIPDMPSFSDYLIKIWLPFLISIFVWVIISRLFAVRLMRYNFKVYNGAKNLRFKRFLNLISILFGLFIQNYTFELTEDQASVFIEEGIEYNREDMGFGSIIRKIVDLSLASFGLLHYSFVNFNVVNQNQSIIDYSLSTIIWMPLILSFIFPFIWLGDDLRIFWRKSEGKIEYLGEKNSYLKKFLTFSAFLSFGRLIYSDLIVPTISGANFIQLLVRQLVWLAQFLVEIFSLVFFISSTIVIIYMISSHYYNLNQTKVEATNYLSYAEIEVKVKD